MSKPKKIFLHCGLHKTGTTALQTVLMENAARLKELGFLYPKTGRLDSLGGGHHNIAWEVSRDRRFDFNLGTIEALIEEIDDFDGTVIISSEDFESVLHDKELFSGLTQAFARCGAEISLIVYLRNQVSYCESLFIENLGQNIGSDFPKYVHDILRYGYVGLHEWVFQFDYKTINRNASELSTNIIFRNFHTLTKKSIIADFFNVVGINPTEFEEAFHFRSNQRLIPANQIKNFYEQRIQRTVTNDERNCIQIIRHMIGDRKFESCAVTVEKFRAAFLKDNLEICSQYGLDPYGLDLDNRETEKLSQISFEKVFSFELQYLIGKMKKFFADKKPVQAAELARDFTRD